MARKPIQMVNIEVDGKAQQVRSDQFLLWSLRDLGYDIPHFCAHRWLEPFGGCRMCMAKIEMGGRMMPKLQTLCSTKPAEGMKIILDDPAVYQARHEQIEFHLINHPLECPVCDKGGECMLQDQVNDHGLAAGRYVEEKRVRPDAIVSEYIRMNYKRCIQCKRCVHFGQDIDGSHLLKFVARGADTRIEGFPIPGQAPRFTGNVIDMCPVGALTARSYRFMGRPWEQELTASIASLDSVGANLWVCGRLGEIARLVPRDNPEVENGLIDDATRFSWEAVDHPARLRQAVIRGDGSEQKASRAEGESKAAQILLQALEGQEQDSVGVIAGGGLNTEEYLALKKFCGEVLNTQYYFFGEPLLGPGGTSGPGAEALNSFCNDHGSIDEILSASTVLSIGCDLFEEAPSLGLRIDIAARRGLQKLVSMRSHRSDADRFAKVFYATKHGELAAAVKALSAALAGGEIPAGMEQLVAELKAAGDDLAIVYGGEIWRVPTRVDTLKALAGLKEAAAKANPDAAGVYLNPVYPSVNSVGAMCVNFMEALGGKCPCSNPRPSIGSTRAIFEAAVQGKLKALLIIDADPLWICQTRELAEKALASCPVIYAGAYPVPSAEAAAVHLPLGTWVHREGTVVSLEWRVQKRERAVVSSFAPSVVEILSGIAIAMGREPVGLTVEELAAELASALPGYPGDKFGAFPKAGLRWKVNAAVSGAGAPAAEPPVLPPQTGSLTVIPKRFLYNDRPEIRFSPVFERVTLPFFAFLNPADAAQLGLAEGDALDFEGGGKSYRLPVKPALWVQPGTVVINDYHLNVPANVGLNVKAPVRAGGSGTGGS